MSIDTVQKRYSMLNFGDGTNIYLLFEADGDVALDDQQHQLDLYSGIVFEDITIPSSDAWRPQSYNQSVSTGRALDKSQSAGRALNRSQSTGRPKPT